MMSGLLDTLQSICQENVLREKWLLVKNFRAGNQWIDAIAARGVPVVNLRLHTIRTLLMDLVRGQPFISSRRLVSSNAGMYLIDRIWKRVKQKENGYITTLPPTPMLFRSMYRTIQTLRLVGISNFDQQKITISNSVKHKEIGQFLSEYQRLLEENRWVDYPMLLDRAIHTQRINQNLFPPHVLLLIPETLELIGLENRLLQCAPPSQVVRLPIDRPDPTAVSSILFDRDLVHFIESVPAAPPPVQDGSMTIIHATGECNEVRQVLRWCVKHTIPFDQIEILYSDSNTYLPLLYEITHTLNDSFPITYAEGIPISYSTPARALLSWMQWIQSDCPQDRLARMIHDHLLVFPERENETISDARLASLLQTIKIGLGRDRYEPQIQNEILRVVSKQQADLSSPHEKELSESRKEPYQKQQHRLRVLLACVQRLLNLTPAPETPAERRIEAITRFMTELAASRTEFDFYSRKFILDRLEEISDWLDRDAEPAIDLWDYFKQIVAESRVLAKSPVPGHIHAAPLHDGGHSGRRYTFILGMDDTRFPGRRAQDPILLDDERIAISDELPTAAGRQDQALQSLVQLLCRNRGNLFFSYASRSIQDNREQFPASVIMNIYRLISGNHSGELHDLLQWLGPPVSFAPLDSIGILGPQEWWLTQLDAAIQPGDLYEFHSHFQQGQEAIEQRRGALFTIYDGLVAQAGRVLDPSLPNTRHPISATLLETVGTCPLRYFFRYGLNLEVPEETVVDSSVWLSPVEFGGLMHSIFETFMREKIEQASRPRYPDDLPRMERIMEDTIALYKTSIPPPNEDAYRRQYDQIERGIQIFLKEEDEYCRRHRPVVLEEEWNSEISVERQTLLARGIIDRIDLEIDSNHHYKIWDYKSGSTYKYKENDPFQQGRVMQHVLYLELFKDYLIKNRSKQAVITHFGFFFPNVKAHGERIQWSAEDLTKGKNLIGTLCQIIRQGAFLATNDPNDCAFCEYQAICGNVERVTQASQAKLDNPLNTRLQYMRRLRNDENHS